MLIRYQPKQDHIKCVPLIPTTEELKKIKLVRTQVQLLPGINEVADDEWALMKVHLSREIREQEITVIEDAAKGKQPGGGKAHDLKDMAVEKAAALIEECVNPDTLQKWYQEETREEVRLAIIERMKELKLEIPKFKPKVKGEKTDSEPDKSSETGKPEEGKK